MLLNLLSDHEDGSLKFWKLNDRGVDQINLSFSGIGSLRKLGLPLLFYQTLKPWQKYSQILSKVLESTEEPRIWVPQIFEIQMQKGAPNNSAVLPNWFPPRN